VETVMQREARKAAWTVHTTQIWLPWHDWLISFHDKARLSWEICS
jgi:hypothetical protein